MTFTRKIICLTPIKNEAWILERFLKCASLWADHIIIADQESDDGSEEIAKSHPRVIYVKNDSTEFNEPERQKLLIDAARKIPGDKVLIALDADEALTSNFINSPEWQTLINSPVGTVINFQWVNLMDDMQHCWIPDSIHPFGFVDDGSEHNGRLIHSHRVPLPSGAPVLSMREVKVLHYQYTDRQRMLSKQRWYQVYEWRHNSQKSSVYLYRLYHHMETMKSVKKTKILNEWIYEYQRLGIDMTSVKQDMVYRWDKTVLDLMTELGRDYFKRVPIWDVDWSKKAKELGYKAPERFKDPRSCFHVFLHSWLRLTQPKSRSFFCRVIDALLKKLGL